MKAIAIVEVRVPIVYDEKNLGDVTKVSMWAMLEVSKMLKRRRSWKVEKVNVQEIDTV